MSDDSFYERWSRRKKTEKTKVRPQRAFSNLFPGKGSEPQGKEVKSEAAEVPPIAETPPILEQPLAAPEIASAPEKQAARSGEPAADLPDPESLTYDSDFSGFLREGVSEELRRAALRKLWRSSPVLANLDGLNDYDEDFRKEAITGSLKTAYDTVKGFGQSNEAPERESLDGKPSEFAEMSLDEDPAADNEPQDEGPGETAAAAPDGEESGPEKQA